MMINKEFKAEYLKCALEPKYFIENYLSLPDRNNMPFKLNPYQDKLLGRFIKEKICQTWKNRNVGFTSIALAYIAWFLTFNDNICIMLICNKLRTGNDYLRVIIKWIKNLGGQINSLDAGIRYGDCHIKVFSPANSPIRGMTPSLIFWDEYLPTVENNICYESIKPMLDITETRMIRSS